MWSFPSGDGSRALENGKPIMAGGKDGLAPWSSGLVYTHRSKGYAFLSDKDFPDVFMLGPRGLPSNVGLWRCIPEGIAQDGGPIYRTAGKIPNPFDGTNKFPSRFRIFQDGKGVWMVILSSQKELSIARWNGNVFVPEGKYPIDAIPNVTDIDIIGRGKRNREIVFLCNDGTKYRPDEDPTASKLSYYDGAGIYRGSLPKGRLLRIIMTDDWKQKGDVEELTSWIIQGPSTVAAVKSSDGSFDGYVVGSVLGALKFVPYSEKNPGGSLKAVPLRTPEGTVRDHGAYSNQLSAYPDREKGRTSLLIGGECAPRIYSMISKDGPVYGDYSLVWQRNAALYGGSLVVPNVVDWDGDGALDIVSGNSEGRLLFFKNAGSNVKPDFLPPEELKAAGEPIRLLPGYYVVQGPFEGAWGYLCPTVFDWNGDGLPDVMVSGSRARFEVMLNVGTATEPMLAAPKTLLFDGMELHGTWRVRPAITLIDGMPHILIMDDDNALHLYRRLDDTHVEDAGLLLLENGKRITGHNEAGEGLGQRGRGKLRFCDWDGDGDLDLFVGTVKRSSYPSPEDGLPYRRFKEKQIDMQVLFFENLGNWRFAMPKQLQIDGRPFYLGAHSNAPEPCMLGNVEKSLPNLVVGCESGKFFFFERSHISYVE